MKYIMYRATVAKESIFVPIVFPNILVHAQMAAVVGALLSEQFEKVALVSAGDVSIFGTEVTTSGKSETLKLMSRPGDAAIIHNWDYAHGIEGSWMDAILAKALKEKKP